MPNEELQMSVQPHPASFFHLYVIFFVLLVWGFIIQRFFSQNWFSQIPLYSFISLIPGINEVVIAALFWSVGLFLAGFLARYFFLESGGRRLFQLYVGLSLVGISIMILHLWKVDGDTMIFGRRFIPLFTYVAGAGGMVGVDQYRRSFTYHVTDKRLVMEHKFFGILEDIEHIVRYEHVTSTEVKQGMIGKIFGFGTVIPVMSSGIGTGTDETTIMAGVGSKVKGIFFGGGGATTRTVKEARASPFHSLFGVPDPGHVRDTIEENRDSASSKTISEKQIAADHLRTEKQTVELATVLAGKETKEKEEVQSSWAAREEKIIAGIAAAVAGKMEIKEKEGTTVKSEEQQSEALMDKTDKMQEPEKQSDKAQEPEEKQSDKAQEPEEKQSDKAQEPEEKE